MNRRTLLVSFFGSLFLLSAIVIAARTEHASGYEVNIYESLSGAFWFSLSSSIVIGLAMLVFIAPSRTRHCGKAIGFSLVFIGIAALLLVPALRGYAAYGRGDVLTHVGWAVHIVQTGVVAQSDIYPVNHILMACLSMTSGVKTLGLSLYLPQFFFIAGLLWWFVAASLLFKDTRVRYLLFALAVIPLFNNVNSQIVTAVTLAPNAQFYLMCPLVLALFLKLRQPSSTARLTLIIVTIVVLVVLFHPLAMLFLPVTFLIGSRFMKWTGKMASSLTTAFRARANLLALLSIVIFFAWGSYIYVLVGDASRILYGVTEGSSISELQTYLSIVSLTGPYWIHVLSLMILSYGSLVIVGLLTAMSIQQGRRKSFDTRHSDLEYPFLVAGVVVFVILASLVFFLPYSFQFGRILVFAALFSLPLVAYWLSGRIALTRDASIPIVRVSTSRLTVMATLVCILLLSLFSLFPSPYVRMENQQVTDSEVAGVWGFMDTVGNDARIWHLGANCSRFADAIFGVGWDDVDGKSLSIGHPPDHFGYQETAMIGEGLDSTTYLVYSSAGREYYPSVFPEYAERWRFNDSDFARLDYDSYASRVISNGCVDAWILLPAD